MTKRESEREVIMITRISRGESERLELGFDPLEEKHGVLEGFGELLLVLGQHLAVSFHELIQGWVFSYATSRAPHDSS